MIKTLAIAIFSVYIPFSIYVVYASWAETNTVTRPESRPFVFVGDPTTPECSVRIAVADYDKFIAMGVYEWASVCQAIEDNQ